MTAAQPSALAYYGQLPYSAMTDDELRCYIEQWYAACAQYNDVNMPTSAPVVSSHIIANGRAAQAELHRRSSAKPVVVKAPGMPSKLSEEEVG